MSVFKVKKITMITVLNKWKKYEHLLNTCTSTVYNGDQIKNHVNMLLLGKM